jgi:uncharacterized membrane protein YfcA
MLGDLLPLLPLGLLAGLLSGLLGIGGGLVFSPMLLLVGLSPHQALATSTLAIVFSTLGGTWAHLANRALPLRAALSIGGSALLSGFLFSHLGFLLRGWQLLALQAVTYALLAMAIRPGMAMPSEQEPAPVSLPGLAAVGTLAGFAAGLLGLGGGLLMVPLMVRGLAVPIRQAIRFSTLAVLCSASAASTEFLISGRGVPAMGLMLGITAAIAARWSAARLHHVGQDRLAWMIRLISVLLAFDSGRRALNLLMAG